MKILILLFILITLSISIPTNYINNNLKLIKQDKDGYQEELNFGKNEKWQNNIPNKYIILLKNNISLESQTKHVDWLKTLLRKRNSNTNEIIHEYNFGNVKGYSGIFDSDIMNELKKSEEISLIEVDKIVRINELKIQKNSPWGLSRISRGKNSESSRNYYYDSKAGKNVTVYIIDTGIQIEHEEFQNRATWGANFSSESEDKDTNGHGTHVAGIVAGKTYGVAKSANVVAVKVLDKEGEGSLSDVLKGIDFVVNDHIKKTEESPDDIIHSVVNLSLGTQKSRAFNYFIKSVSIENGINFVVAAGNDSEEACDYSPASADAAITVGAINDSDHMVYFSNYGECVDILAPGMDIISSWIGSNDETSIATGTSMASPHVSGTVALLLSLKEYSKYSPEQMKKLIIDLSTKNILKDLPIWAEKTPNRLLYTKPPIIEVNNDTVEKKNKTINSDKNVERLTFLINNINANDEPKDIGDIIDHEPTGKDDEDDDDKDKDNDGRPDDLDDIDDSDSDSDNDKDKDKDDGKDDDDKNDKPDDLDDIIDDDDDKPDDNKRDRPDEDNSDKPDDLDDIIDDDDDNKDKDENNTDKPDDLDDIVDDDDDNYKDKPDDDKRDNPDDEKSDKPDDLNDIIDEDDDNGNNGDKDKDNDDNKSNKPDDLDDVIDDDDNNGNKDKDKDDDKSDKPDDLDDIIDDIKKNYY